jgi:hypothetical protein
LINTTKEREKDKGVKIDYVKVASVVEYGAFNALFGDDTIPRSKDPRCPLCDTFHKPNLNCGPTLETKLKTKDEIDKLVQNVSVLAKVLGKPPGKRSDEDDKRLRSSFKGSRRLKHVCEPLRRKVMMAKPGRPPRVRLRTVSTGRSKGIATRTTRALAVLITTRPRRAAERPKTRRMLIQARTGRLRRCVR